MRDEILKGVADEFGVTVEDLQGRSKLRRISRARHLAAWMLWHAGDTLLTVGKLLGDRHYSTVIYGVQMADVLMKTDKAYRLKTKTIFEITGFKVRVS